MAKKAKKPKKVKRRSGTPRTSKSRRRPPAARAARRAELPAALSASAALVAVAPPPLQRFVVRGDVETAARQVIDPRVVDADPTPEKGLDARLAFWWQTLRAIAQRLEKNRPQYTVPEPTEAEAIATFSKPISVALEQLTDNVFKATSDAGGHS